MKICFTSSSGGHFEQLMMLLPLMERYDSFILTEDTGYSDNADVRIYKLLQINRHGKLFIPYFLINTLRSLAVFIIERPDVIVSTGVLATIPMSIIGKIAGCKLIYIESFAKINSPTETGKFVYKFADRFYVQWETMLDVYPKAVFVGSIY